MSFRFHCRILPRSISPIFTREEREISTSFRFRFILRPADIYSCRVLFAVLQVIRAGCHRFKHELILSFQAFIIISTDIFLSSTGCLSNSIASRSQQQTSVVCVESTRRRLYPFVTSVFSLAFSSIAKVNVHASFVAQWDDMQRETSDGDGWIDRGRVHVRLQAKVLFFFQIDIWYHLSFLVFITS